MLKEVEELHYVFMTIVFLFIFYHCLKKCILKQYRYTAMLQIRPIVTNFQQTYLSPNKCYLNKLGVKMILNVCRIHVIIAYIHVVCIS